MSNSETLEKTERKTNWINDIMPILSERYKDWSITAIEDKKAIFLYNDFSAPKKEITFIETEGDNILIVIKSLLQKKELTDGGLRVLNHLNCGLYFMTHQIDIENRIYKCRFIISKDALQNQFETAITYLEGEHQKGKMLLDMECR